MGELTELIRSDMKPALGVTEPGAIAFAVSTARAYTSGELLSVAVKLNSGLYKNAYTCGIPGTDQVGNVFAAALGAVAGVPERGLQALSGVTDADNEKAQQLVTAGKVKVNLKDISPRISIEAVVATKQETCIVQIQDSHTEIRRIILNNDIIFEGDTKIHTDENIMPRIHNFTVTEMIAYADTAAESELSFIDEAYEMNMALFYEGLNSPKTVFVKTLYAENDNQVFTADIQKTAQLLCNGAIEARVLGLERPAMSITGSGAHGIICTLPLYACYKAGNIKKVRLLRATALSYLITMYIKEYSGKLSAFCGCAIAAGTGMACAYAYLRGGDGQVIADTIQNMASGITGMICDGGNQGCVMKGIVAVDAAFRAVDFALKGVRVENIHGINGSTPEQTMENMGKIASPGMIKTEQTILDIIIGKQGETKGEIE